MAGITLEELQNRLTILEAQVAQLLAENKQPREKDWRRTIGMFTGNEGMIEIMDAALRIREEDREAARNDPHYFDEDQPE